MPQLHGLKGYGEGREVVVVSVHASDVAKYILQDHGPMSTMKLQKLVYYCQAYQVAWTGKPMFREAVRAWTHGPVIYELFSQHRGMFEVAVDDIDGDADALDDDMELVVGAVTDALNELTGWELRNRTHDEGPWRDAFDPEEPRHNQEITLDAMRDYYSSR